MKKIVREIVSYRCEICATDYPSRKTALECEQRRLEVKQFKIGDMVQSVESHVCGFSHKLHRPTGHIHKIEGPLPSDDDTELRWLGGQPDRINGHVFLYHIRYACGRCGRKKETQFWAPEIRKT